MEYYGKNKKVYKGAPFAFIFMIVVPVVFYFLFYFVLIKANTTPSLAIYVSLALAGLIGVLFDLICIITGLISDLFTGFIHRIKSTFSLFKPFEKGAASYYFNQFIEDGGPLLWAFLLILALTIAVTIYGGVNYLSNIEL